MTAALLLSLQVPRDTLRASGDTVLASGDTLAAAAGAIRDTLSDAPLPGGVATVLRFLFQVPQWIQIAGAIVGAGVAAALLLMLWRRRFSIVTWLRTRSRQVQAAMGTGVLLLVGGAALAGMKSWDYMQHENAFCTGCHIMERPFRRFAAGAGRHEELKCHDCHQQSIWASTRQLVLWVAERPEKIGAHAGVPNVRCESCHQVQGGREKWQHVRRLAGHRVHFESDSTPLERLQCIKCHGAEVHKFLPSSRTCEQSGCHEQQPIKLGHMALLPEISCLTCHEFAADLPGLAGRDSALGAMRPAREQCFSCHQMKQKLTGYDVAKDPHQGSCGSCHDVHADLVPADARASCKQCHGDLSKSPFHGGASHVRVRERCVTCHQPHAAAVDASDCVSCHDQARRRGLFKAPLPFDTAAVLRRRLVPLTPVPSATSFWEHDPPSSRGPSEAMVEELEPRVRASPPVMTVPARDSFPHARHQSLACLTCHRIDVAGRAGRLTFQPPRGCALCHHQNWLAGQSRPGDCARCHRSEVLAVPQVKEVRVQVGTRAPVARAVAFRHDRHAKLACADCHRPPEATPADSVGNCTACHDQHHTEQSDCLQCHTRDTNASHSRATHVGCAECHQPARVAKLVPARAFCVSCHAKERDHLPGRECSICHFLATPTELRPRLLRAGVE